MSTDAKEFCAGVLGPTERLEPFSTTAHNSWAHRDCLHVCDGGRTAIKTSVSWEWGLKSWATRLTLERLDEGGLFTTDVGASARVDIDIKVIARIACILSEEALGIGFVDSTLQLNLFVPELTTNVDVSSFGTHGEANNKSSFNEFVGIVSHDFTVLASTWLRFVSVDHQVLGSTEKRLVGECEFTFRQSKS